jgi:hypothetical protein
MKHRFHHFAGARRTTGMQQHASVRGLELCSLGHELCSFGLGHRCNLSLPSQALQCRRFFFTKIHIFNGGFDAEVFPFAQKKSTGQEKQHAAGWFPGFETILS